MTTNGTIMNDEILDWIIKNDFLLKVSIDGKKEINDLNRIAKNGEVSLNRFKKTGITSKNMRIGVTRKYRLQML